MRGRLIPGQLKSVCTQTWMCAALTVAVAGSCVSPSAEAQPRRTFPATPASFERDSLDSLSRDILESETLRFDRLRENSLRSFPDSTQLRAPTAELEKIRPLLSDAAAESSSLVSNLNEDMRRIPSLRPLFTDTLRLRAQAQLLTRRSTEVNDHRLIAEELQALDAGWRDLSFQFSRTRDLSPRTQDSVRSINELARLMEQILKIEPQFDRWSLLQKVSQLTADLQRLTEDIEFELNYSNEAQQILLATSRVQQQANSLINLLQYEGDRVAVVDSYKRFQTLWYPQAAKLQAINNRNLERTLRSITQADGEIAQILLLQQTVDKDQLIYLTSALRSAIDTFDDNMSLREVTRLPNARMALSTVDQFYGVCDNFIDNVRRGESHDALIDAFRYIEDARREFVAVFRSTQNNAALGALRQIEQSLETLATALQVRRTDFDRSTAMQLAAEVANLSDQLDYTAQRWISRERPSYGTVCLRDTAAFADGSARLQQLIVRGGTTSQLQQEVTNLYDTWRAVYNHLVKCQTEERPLLGRLSSQITPAMVELRTMVSH